MAKNHAVMPSILVAVMLLAIAVVAEALPPGKVHRIGYLSGRRSTNDVARFRGIKLALREFERIGSGLATLHIMLLLY